MIRYTQDGLPLRDPAWLQDELSDRGDWPVPDEEGSDNDASDGHLEQAYEDAQTGGGESGLLEEDEITPDEELEAWLIAREAELEEQSFALADQFDEEGPR